MTPSGFYIATTLSLLGSCLVSAACAPSARTCCVPQAVAVLPECTRVGHSLLAPPGTRFFALRGGGQAMSAEGDAITEEQAGEELIKAAVEANIEGLDPPGLNLLVQAGAPVNYQDMWKRTPLHYAAREGKIESIQRLVDLGGDLTAQDFLGRTPLHLAARKGHADAVVLLAQLGSDLNHADKNPWPNNSGRTPLHWACYKGHPEVVWRLCEQGADMEARDAMSRTPLHWAGRRGQRDCVQVLLVMGADAHAVDNKKMKAINLANSKESNAPTQQLLHTATIRGQLPTELPVFVPTAASSQALEPRAAGGKAAAAAAAAAAVKGKATTADHAAPQDEPEWAEDKKVAQENVSPGGGEGGAPQGAHDMQAAIARAQALYGSGGAAAAAGNWREVDDDDDGVEYA